MVVLEDGLPRKSEYRRFKIQRRAGQRRLRGHGGGADPAPDQLPRASASKPVERARRRFAYPPQLLLVDGGKGQLGVAERVLDELGPRPTRSRSPRWPSGSRRSTCPGRADPVRIPRQCEALYLLQRVRDEAHRFAITYHRELRGKRMTKSVLDDIPGLGPARKKRLVKELGGVGAVKQAVARRAAGAAAGCPTRWPTPCYDKIHGPTR